MQSIDVLVVGEPISLAPLSSHTVEDPYQAINWLWEGNEAKVVLTRWAPPNQPRWDLRQWVQTRRPEVALFCLVPREIDPKKPSKYWRLKKVKRYYLRDERLSDHELAADLAGHIYGSAATLTRAEARVMALLRAKPAISRCAIMRAVAGECAGNCKGNAVGVHIYNMRRKGIRIETIRGKGYRLVR